MAFIEFRHVKKTYGSKDSVEIKALDGAEFTVEQGELAVILGASGAGKTTALNILGGMDSVTSGEVIVDGTYINQCKGKDLVEFLQILNPIISDRMNIRILKIICTAKDCFFNSVK